MAIYLQFFFIYSKNIKDIFDAIQYFLENYASFFLFSDSGVILDILYKKHMQMFKYVNTYKHVECVINLSKEECSTTHIVVCIIINYPFQHRITN